MKVWSFAWIVLIEIPKQFHGVFMSTMSVCSLGLQSPFTFDRGCYIYGRRVDLSSYLMCRQHW